MKRVLIVGVLLAIMLGLRALKADSATGAVDPLTLAAIGFVVLASFSVAELGVRVGLPRVTGYIVAGVMLGPSVGNILSPPVVSEMRTFNTLALGLIATSAGLELDIAQLKRLYKTLLTTVGLKIVTGLVLVGGAVYAYQTIFRPFDLAAPSAALALGIVFAALSIGTSPAIALAVINDSKAKGRLAELVLGAAIVKDLVVVVCLAIAVAVARPLFDPSASLEGAILVHVAQELGSSIVAGAILGVLLIAYVRFVHKEMLLFVAVVVLVVSELGRALHLELLLVFITAGFIVRNFSKYEHEILHPLEMVALPVFVVFFTIAGAGVDLGATWAVLPLAIAVVVARAVGFGLSARVAGKLTGEPAIINKTAWLGYLPQAGVTLGLVGLAAGQLGAAGGSIQTLGMATVALNLLVGPITLRYALGRFAAESSPAAATTSMPPPAAVDADEREPETDPDNLPEAELAHSSLRNHVRATRLALVAEVDRFLDERFGPWARSEQHELIEMGATQDSASRVREWVELRRAQTTLPQSAARELWDRLYEIVKALPSERAVELLDSERRIGSGDPSAVRWRKRRAAWRRLVSRGTKGHQRVVPVRLSARVHVEPRLATLARAVFDTWVRLELTLIGDLRRWVQKDLTRDELGELVERRLSEARLRLRSDAVHHIERSLSGWVMTLERVGGPAMPTSELSYSAVREEVATKLRELSERPELWGTVLRAELVRTDVAVHMAELQQRAYDALGEHVVTPAEHAADGAMACFSHVRSAVTGALSALQDETDSAEDVEASFVGAIEQHAGPHIDEVVASFRGDSSSHVAAQQIRETVASLPNAAWLPTDDCEPAELADPSELRTFTTDVLLIAREELVYELLPMTEEGVRLATVGLTEAAGGLREVVGAARYAFDVAQNSEEDDEARRRTLVESLERVLKKLAGVEAAALDGLSCCRGIRDEPLRSAFDRMRGRLAGRALAGAGGGISKLLLRQWVAIRARLAPVTAVWGKFQSVVRSYLDSDLSRGLQRRIEGAALDSAEIRTSLDALADAPALPAEYARLFAAEPVRERRFFIAHRPELDEVLLAERSWNDGAPGSVILSGPPGSGRSSLLNVAEFELRAKRVVRIVNDGSARTRLLDELALELGCRRNADAVRRSLAATRTTVIIDDLEWFFAPTWSGMAALADFLELVLETRGSTFWLVSVGSSTLELYDEALQFRQAFAKTVELGSLDAATLREVIERRHRMSGRELSYPSTRVGRLLSRVRRGLDADVYHRILSGLSDGNLALALAIWSRSVQIDPEGDVRASLPSPLIAQMPFVPRLSASEQSVLLTLLRWGARPAEELADLVGLSGPAARQSLSYLHAAGLIQAPHGPNGRVVISPTLAVPLRQSFASMGAR